MYNLYEELNKKGYEGFIQTLKILQTFEALSPANIFPLIADSFKKIEDKDFRVSNIFMSNTTYAILRKIDKNVHSIDDETNKDRVKKGITAYLWGANLHTTEIPDNKILLISDEINIYSEMDEVSQPPTAMIIHLDEIIFNQERYPDLFTKKEKEHEQT